MSLQDDLAGDSAWLWKVALAAVCTRMTHFGKKGQQVVFRLQGVMRQLQDVVNQGRESEGIP